MRPRSITGSLNPTEKARLLVDRSSSLPIDGQCELVGIARSTFYYKPTPKADDEMIRQEVLRINENLRTSLRYSASTTLLKYWTVTFQENA